MEEGEIPWPAWRRLEGPLCSGEEPRGTRAPGQDRSGARRRGKRGFVTWKGIAVRPPPGSYSRAIPVWRFDIAARSPGGPSTDRQASVLPCQACPTAPLHRSSRPGCRRRTTIQHAPHHALLLEPGRIGAAAHTPLAPDLRVSRRSRCRCFARRRTRRGTPLASSTRWRYRSSTLMVPSESPSASPARPRSRQLVKTHAAHRRANCSPRPPASSTAPTAWSQPLADPRAV